MANNDLCKNKSTEVCNKSFVEGGSYGSCDCAKSGCPSRRFDKKAPDCITPPVAGQSLTQEKITTYFVAYTDMAKKVGRKISRKYGVVQDLEDEAVSYLATLLIEKYKKWEPNRASLTTWIWRSIVWHLQTVCQKRLNLREVPIKGLTLSVVKQDQVVGFSEDAEFILSVIRKDKDRMEKEFHLPQYHRLFLEHMMSEYRWSWKRAHSAWVELQETF